MNTDKLMSTSYSKEFAKFKAQFDFHQRLRKDRKRIKDANRRFKMLSDAQKRVAIARDVIKQIGVKIVPKFGTWTGWTPISEDEFFYADGARDGELALSPSIVSDEVKCSACALGAAFICAIRRADDLNIQDANVEFGYSDRPGSVGVGQDKMQTYLGRFFDNEQLELIELAFERGKGGYVANLDRSGYYLEEGSRKRLRIAATMYLPNLRDPADRMRAIMKNVVRNGGQFIVGDEE